MRRAIWNNKGFTLVELPKVVLILGLLSAIIILSYHKFMLRAKESSVKNNMYTIQLGMEGYSMQNDSVYPLAGNEADLRACLRGGAFPTNPYT